MQSATANLLRDLEIPEKCPTCGTSDWNFEGSEAFGIHTVLCGVCRRTYKRMRGSARVAFFAGELHHASNLQLVTAMGAAYAQLVSAYHDFMSRTHDERWTVLTDDPMGTPEDWEADAD